MLADGSSDTAYAGFKEIISAVVCDSKYGGNFACGQVDDIEGSVRSETYLSICQVLDGLIESGRFFRRQTSADRMIGNRIKSRLFLFDDPFSGNGSVRLFQKLVFPRDRPWRLFFAGFLQEFHKVFADTILAQRFLQITGACLCAGFVISECGEQADHRADVQGDFRRICAVHNMDTEHRVRSKTAGTVNGERAVLPCNETKITERCMRFVRRCIGKTDFQFPRHMERREL